MATEIIVNDGGAPSRILPYEGYSDTLLAGDYVSMNASGKIIRNATSGTQGLGYLLTACTSGNIGSVVTGHGVQLNVYVSGTVATGNLLYVKKSASEGLVAIGSDSGSAVAIALEASTGGPGYAKVQVL